MKKLTLIVGLLFVVGCAGTHSKMDMNKFDSTKLAAALATQETDAKARYQYRNPQKTLEFFGISPGMTVVEALPGAGWYSKILLPYLGDNGKLIGVDYHGDMWPLFGFFNEEQIAERRLFPTKWPKRAAEWRGSSQAAIEAHTFGSMPSSLNNSVDAVLFIRALHNLSRFEAEGDYLSVALAEAHRVLKSGGIVGIVQHEAPSSADDQSTLGARGYLKKAHVIDFMKAAGFKYVGSSPINHNPKDVPSDTEIVWRLSPSLATSREDPALKAKLSAIGESNRMTLKFMKP